MRIIQSAWTCNKSSLLTSNSGWLSPEYNLMSWSLSCLQLKQYYPELILYSDSVSAKMLVDTLQLPYTDVECNLDFLNIYHPQLWALPKIMAYSQQEKPFLHVDGDVFIWKKFEDTLLSGNLIAQNMEAATDYYEKIMISLESALNFFPDEIREERKSKNPILAYNAGIFGGNDISFFKEYASKSFDFVGKNILNLSKINVSNFNIFFEQYLFYCLAKKQNKKVNVLLPETIGDNQYKGFGDFGRVPYEKHYLHLLGSYKRNDFVCKQMANRLRQDYPEYYYRIIDLFKKNKLPLFKNYYNLDDLDEVCLVKRYNCLINKSLKVERESITSLNFDFKRDLKKELGNFNLNKSQFIDFEIFNSKINTILRKDFLLLSKDYLYARDCKASFYFQDLFQDTIGIYNKKVIRDNDYQKIESKYNWSSFIEKQKVKKEGEIIKLEESAAFITTLIVPECDQNRFSLLYVDLLDILILDILKISKTIRELLDELKQNFEANELHKNYSEFEELIFGRIKLGLHAKTIKLNYD
ncbi:DUF6734 family protein [Flavobacterium panici]|uniref:DUF6734 domain-containing protein n=1 Tax=Flavobacterium panici TaxID=2654843 RepID=A0A9N8J5R9_9FLAO|nr:DUF6734 family protein [Flavobacterium panici]CAC9976734.1 hypothetical protein FLAPXU55_04462 [Flavobacterium panici]